MTDRLIAVGDDFTLPPEVQVSDENLPAASNAAAVASKLDAAQVGVAGGAAPLDGGSLVPDANLPTRLQDAALGAAFVRKTEQVVSVKDYGAKGDGVTDDTLAIQEVLNFALTRQVRIVFPAGVYVVKQKLFVYSNTTLDLEGSTLRRSFNTGPGGVSLLKWADNTENLTIRNGTIDGNGANYPGITGAEGFDLIHGTGIKNGKFENLVFKDVVGDHALDASTIDGLVVRDCRFTGWKDIVGDRPFSESIQLDPNILDGATGTSNKGVVVTGCYFGPSTTPGFGSPGAGVGNHATVPGRTDSDIKITGNTFDGCGFAGVRGYRWDKVIIQANTFIGGARGIHVTPMSRVDLTPESGTGYTITANTFTGCTSPILFAVPTLGPGNAYSRFKNVAITGNTFDGGTTMINAAFVSQLSITGNSFTNGSEAIRTGYCDGVTISGNTANTMATYFVYIIETAYTATIAALGYTLNTTVAGNTATNIGFRAVHVNSAAKYTTIVGNTFVNLSTAAATRDGIAVDTAAVGGIIEGNNILDGGATNKPVYGINLSASVVNYRIGPNNAYGTTRALSNASPTTTLTGVLVTGTPEGVMVGAVGSTVTRTDGGALTTMYVKESGTGNTGWIAK